MSAPEFAHAAVEGIVSAYAVAAAEHHRASETGDHKVANHQHDVVAAAYRELRARQAEAELMPLLDSADVGVRGWAGAHALEFSPARGEQVLESLSTDPSLAGFTAQMTLQTWRDGKLGFP